MRKQRTSPAEPTSSAARPAVTADRFVRLYHLVELLGNAALDRAALVKKLKVDVRGFYRDLDLLRKAGIGVALREGSYSLSENVKTALARLPFPDPRLTLGDARLLAKGRLRIHQQLKAQIQEM